MNQATFSGDAEARLAEEQLLASLVAEIRGTSRLPPPEIARIDRVRLLLAAQGIPIRDTQAALWLAPVVCATSSQQRLFHRRYAELFDVSEEALPASHPNPPVAAKPFVPFWRRHWRWLAVVVGCAVVAAFIVARLLEAATGPAAEAPTVWDSVQAIFGRKAATTPPPSVAGWIKIVFAGIGVATIFAIVHRLWKRRSRRSRDEDSPDHFAARSLAFAAALPTLYSSTALRRRFVGLRRHRIVPSIGIDLRRTIVATISAGGRPVLVHRTRPLSPDYVLLIDRASPRDHLPVVGQAIARRFAAEGAATTAYDFFGDPRRLRRSFPAEEGAELSLERLVSRHSGARLLFLAEPFHCVDGSGAPEPWLADLAELGAVLINPRPLQSWDWREAEIRACGIAMTDASPEGLARYAEAIQARSPDLLDERAGGKGEFDLATVLDRHRSSLLNETSIGENEALDLIDDLEAWLGEDGTLLLRGAAVFPLVEPALTVLLGTQLQGRTGGPLLTEDALIAVARLPWMRLGRMPEWLRAPLARGLSETQLEIVTRTIFAFLNPAPTGPAGRLELDLDKGENPEARKRLVDWLLRNPTSPYSEPLLLDAMAGRPPAELGRAPVGPDATLARVLAKVDARREAAATVISVLLVLSFAILQPLDLGKLQSPAGTPPSEQNAADAALEAAANAVENAANAADASTSASPAQPTSEAAATSNADAPAPDGSDCDYSTCGYNLSEGPALEGRSDPPLSPGEQTSVGAGESVASSGPGSSGVEQATAQSGTSSSLKSRPAPVGGTVLKQYIVFFDWDKAEITPQAAAMLDSVAKEYIAAEGKIRGELFVRITGHADGESPSPVYSMGLSQRRASSVASFLWGRGIPVESIFYSGAGQASPRIRTKPGVREPQNRRAEIEIVSSASATAN